MKDYIAEFCKKCDYYRKGCFYDYGDSLTKIPCEALRRIKEDELARKGVTGVRRLEPLLDDERYER